MLRVLTVCLLTCLLLHGACGAQVSGTFEPDPPPDPQLIEPEYPADLQPDSVAELTEDAATPPTDAAEPAEQPPYPAEALVGWLKDEPAPDTPVRLRLREAALFAVLDPALRWELVAITPGATAMSVAAVLEMPNGSPGWPLYSVDAAYGPARSAAESGDTFWPLLLTDNRLPLAKLKLVASRPASGTPFAKAVDIVRLADDGAVLRSLASGVVNPEGVPGAGPNWFELKPEPAPEVWAVQVHERLGSGGDSTLLQLSKLDAYAAEVFLRAAVPANAELRLRVYPTGHPAAPQPPTEPDPVEIALAAQGAPELYGELRLLTPFTPEPPAEAAGAAQRLRMPELPGLPSIPAMPGWLPALVLGIAGLLLLWFGIRLMQPPRSS